MPFGVRREVDPLYADSLDLVEADLVAASIVGLGGTRRRVIGHRRHLLIKRLDDEADQWWRG